MARLNPSAVLVLIILFLLLFNPSSAPPSKAEQQHARAVVTDERQKLEVLQNSTFGDFQPRNDSGNWLALPGFEEKHGFKWHLLSRVQDRAKEQAQHAAGLDWEDVYGGTSSDSLLMYRNISGVAKGRWIRSDVGEDLNPDSVNLTAILAPGVSYMNPSWRRNITGAEGRMILHIDDKPSFEDDDQEEEDQLMSLREISGRVTLQDETSHADGWVAAVYGLHHVPSGAVLLTTSSEKFAGIFAVPHLALSEHIFNVSKSSIYQFVNKTINQQEIKHDDTDNPWTSNVVNPEEDPFAPMCELIVYAQQHSIPPYSLHKSYGSPAQDQAMLGLVEDELRFPEGKPLPPPPPLSISATVFSPDCGFVLESKGPPSYVPQKGESHLQGLRYEARERNAKSILTLFALLLAAQLYLLILEIKQASTPARRGRISTLTLSMLSLGSGVTAFGFLFLSGIVTSLFVLSLVIAFLGFMDGLFFAMKFLMDIWAAQEPERLERDRRRERERSARQTSTAVSSNNTQSNRNGSGLPLPVTSTRLSDTGATPIIIPSDQDATQAAADTTITTRPGTTFGAVYTRYCLLLLSIVFVSIWIASSAALWFRTAYTNTLFFIYLSFWVPQIYRNIVRNGRKALTPRFILGQTLLRPLPIAYFYSMTNNVLFVETDIHTLLIYATWLWIQVLILAGQEVLGPRFLVSPAWSWVPAAWDYHPVLREDDEGAMMPIGYSAATIAAAVPSATPTTLTAQISNDEAGPSTLGSGSARKASSGGKGMRVFDCAICMQEIEAPVVSAHAFQPVASASSLAVSTSASAAALASGAPGFLARREYMVTPCRHIFHSACLEHWIGYRLQCPICRETLPPL